jgi:multidrug resistance efflux pump
VSATDSSNRLDNQPLPPGPEAKSPSRAPLQREKSGLPPRPQIFRSELNVRQFSQSLLKAVATLMILLLAGLAALVIWSFYVTAPWTRDGRVRVQVASIAPQVSGQVVELRAADNQYVHKGDVLYVIDPFDFKVAVDEAKQELEMKAADAEVKRLEAERRKKLTDLATTPEEQQQYVGSSTQALAAFKAAQSQLAQAEINLKRTQVRSPVNGYVTNLLMRVGDYAHEGTTNMSVIDADSYWIDGYFEETKLAHICVGDRAEARLVGYPQPIIGRVDTITRGIGVSDAAPGTQGLPNVDPIYTWVRLAQRVPIRIVITDVPAGVPLVSGLTATITIRDSAASERSGWFARRWRSVADRFGDIFYGPQPRPSCISPVMGANASISTLAVPGMPPQKTPAEIAPGIAAGLTESPQ